VLRQQLRRSEDEMSVVCESMTSVATTIDLYAVLLPTH